MHEDVSHNAQGVERAVAATNPTTGSSILDPLYGVGRFNDPAKYAALVNPDFIHVSPVYKSDISALDGVGEPVLKGVNAQGDRRGLLAFKIVGWRNDPRGGSYLRAGGVISRICGSRS